MTKVSRIYPVLAAAAIALTATHCRATENSTTNVDVQKYAERLQFADGLYTREMYDLAAREYDNLLSTFPDGKQNDAATFRLAESLRLQGRIKEAAKLYSRIVFKYKKSPFPLRAAYRRARIYMDEGDYISAAAHFNAILNEKLPPELAAATLFYLGESQLKSNLPEKADAAFDRLVTEYKDSAFHTHALMYRGEIYRDRWLAALEKSGGKPEADPADAEKALVFFEHALKAEKSNRMAAEDLFQMAEIYFRQQKFAKSTELYHKLMKLYPQDERAVTARLQAAWSAENSEMYADALALARKALADSSTEKQRAEWLYLKANAERQLLQNREAVKTYLQLLIKYPASRFAVPSRYEIAVTYYKMGKYEDAIRHAEMIRISPEVRSDVSWLLAESYAALNRGAEAVQYYSMVVKADPDSNRARDAMYRLAHQLQSQQSWNEASQAYNQLAAHFPKSDLAPKALYGSAYCMEQIKDYEAAVRDWRRLANGYPDSKLVEDALYQKAVCEIRLHRGKDANASLDELLRRFPDGRYLADAYYWKGVLADEQKRYQQAEEFLRKAQMKSSRVELKNDAAFQLGMVLQQLKRPNEAADIFRSLLDSPVSSKFSPPLLEWLALYYSGRKEYDNAAKAAGLLVQAPRKAWQQAGFVLQGKALDGSGKTESAAKAYEQGLKIAVTTRYAAEAALRLGEIALANHDAATAADRFKAATAESVAENRQTVQPHAFFGLGRAAEIGGNLADAARYYMSVAILYDDPQLVPEALYRAASAYAALRRKDDCRKTAQELLQRYPKSEWARKVDKKWLN